jgi:hypothetical protein
MSSTKRSFSFSKLGPKTIVLLSAGLAFILFDAVYISLDLNRFFFRAHDIPNIPYHFQFRTSENLILSVHEKNFKKTYYGPGQVSSYLNDERIFEPRIQRIETDANGLRNTKFDRKYDVIIAGDSFAFGYGSDQDQTIASYVESLSNLNTYNLGVYGSDIPSQVELLSYLLSKNLLFLNENPLIVLTVFEGNDFNDKPVYSYQHSGTFNSVFRELLTSLKNRSVLPKLKIFIKDFLSKNNSNSTPYVILDSPSLGPVAFHVEYINNIALNNQSAETAKATYDRSQIHRALMNLKRISKEYNSRVLVVYIPDKSRILSGFYLHLPQTIADRMVTLLSENVIQNEFQFMNMIGSFEREASEGRLVFWRDDTHLNNYGYQLIASKLIQGSK